MAGLRWYRLEPLVCCSRQFFSLWRRSHPQFIELTDTTISESVRHRHHGIKGGDYFNLLVSDTGTGISENILHSIFEPYFTTKPVGEGTGLGLSVAHGIIKSMRGDITVKSKVGVGKTFTIWLPILKKQVIEQEMIQAPINIGIERILFVDDEPSIAKMNKYRLEEYGYAVDDCTSSLEALERFKNKPDGFDLVITDMTMPHMAGDQLAVELMKINPRIPVILCTGYSKRISKEKAEKIGIRAFLMKPLKQETLLKTVRDVLDGVKGGTERL